MSGVENGAIPDVGHYPSTKKEPSLLCFRRENHVLRGAP